jgi:hypothetical protein
VPYDARSSAEIAASARRGTGKLGVPLAGDDREDLRHLVAAEADGVLAEFRPAPEPEEPERGEEDDRSDRRQPDAIDERRHTRGRPGSHSGAR